MVGDEAENRLWWGLKTEQTLRYTQLITESDTISAVLMLYPMPRVFNHILKYLRTNIKSCRNSLSQDWALAYLRLGNKTLNAETNENEKGRERKKREEEEEEEERKEAEQKGLQELVKPYYKAWV